MTAAFMGDKAGKTEGEVPGYIRYEKSLPVMTEIPQAGVRSI